MKRIIFSIDERESLNLELLLAKYGGKAPAFFKHLLKEAFKKEYGGYNSPSDQKIKPIEPELTIQQWVESKGGQVKKINGIDYAYVGVPADHWKWPLSEEGEVKRRLPKEVRNYS